jgi:hypothetical protein
LLRPVQTIYTTGQRHVRMRPVPNVVAGHWNAARMQTWTLTDLEQAVRHAWARDTCDPDDLADWRPDNPARGQCGVTALVLQDLIGGDLVLGEVHVGATRTGRHWWNRLPSGLEVDLTREQFSAKEMVTGGQVVHRPAGPPRSCREQYDLLRYRVFARLDVHAQPTARVDGDVLGAEGRVAGDVESPPDGDADGKHAVTD